MKIALAKIKRALIGVGATGFSLLLLSCSGHRPANLGVTGSGLAPCPASPNCVSSDSQSSDHKVEPFHLATSSDQAWQAAQRTVAELTGVQIVTETADYLHAECRSQLLGFIDDLELNLRSAEGVIAVRSASRFGYYDFGVNRDRIDSLRSLLVSRGVLK